MVNHDPGISALRLINFIVTIFNFILYMEDMYGWGGKGKGVHGGWTYVSLAA